MPYWILTDAGGDLPESYVSLHEKLHVIPMPYRLDGREHQSKPGDEKTISAFYQKLIDGHLATTSQISTADYYNAFKELVTKGEEVLYISLSSGISGTLQSAEIARTMLLDEYPSAKVNIVDSLCASLGQGLLVDYALKNRAAGMSLDEATVWLVNNRQQLIHWFTVSDLNFLFRGGRVTRTAALVGSVLRIKPVMHVNFEGKLIPVEKVQGRKRSLRALAEKAAQYAVPAAGQTMFISHGDCADDAQYVANTVRELLPGTGDIMISPVGALIGSHSGPGTLALFFTGDSR